MPDWLTSPPGASLTTSMLLLRLGLSVGAGLLIAVVYRVCLRRPIADAAPMATSLVLLSVLVAMTTMVIDNNVARAFSLVGALAIVRFRTVVEDTRDTAFVIYAVVAGMAAGVGNFALCLTGVPIVAAVALALSWAAPRRAPQAAESSAEQPLLVRIGTGDRPAEALEPALQAHLASHRLVRTATARAGAALELTYTVRLKEGSQPVTLVSELNTVKGVQHVELGES